jgi:hypothetical protein
MFQDLSPAITPSAGNQPINVSDSLDSDGPRLSPFAFESDFVKQREMDDRAEDGADY